MPALYRRHDAAGQAKYQEVKQLARSQARVLAGTPGILKQRTVAGKQYWMREYIRPDGKKTDEYLGSAASVEKARVDAVRAQIELARALAAGSAQLRLFGYQRIDRKPAAVLAVFFNRGLVHAGLTLVGSHAYGVLLNELGIRAAGDKNDDVAMGCRLPLSVHPPEGASLASLLAEAALAPRALAVDLLAPGDRVGEIVPVKELAAHAQTIPLLDFLIDEALDGVVLSPNQIIPVRVPAPERFALHKLLSSQSRRADRDKIRKDLRQAAVLAAAVEEETPERLSDAYKSMPAAGRHAVRRGALAAARLLEPTHPETRQALLTIGSRRR